MIAKGPECQGCALWQGGSGYVPADGAENAPLLVLGEAAGREEVLAGKGFVGPSGAFHWRWSQRAGYKREDCRVGNVVACFPGDTLVAGRGVLHAYRRWYDGILISVRTRRSLLSGTPNHPVLTRRGWVALGDLHKSDHLCYSRFGEGLGASDPDEEDIPTSFVERFDALAMTHVGRRIVGRDVDFHGDGRDADVEVVCAHGELRDTFDSSCLKAGEERVLETSCSRHSYSLRGSATDANSGNLLGGLDSSGGSLMRSSDERYAATFVQPLPPGPHRLGTVPEHSAASSQESGQTIWADAVLQGETFEPSAFIVEPTEILEIGWQWFSGHVYNLHTESGQYTANGVVVHNCRPPQAFDGKDTPPPFQAIVQCAWQREALFREPHKAILTLGATATREALRFFGHEFKGSLDEWRGYVVGDGSHPWIIPSYHPSFISQYSKKHSGVYRHDIAKAWEVATQGFVREPTELIVDPPADWFSQWAQQCADDDWLAVDIETPKGNPEMGPSDPSWRILRVNFAYNREQGITVPYEGSYLPTIRRLLARNRFACVWNGHFDAPRLRKAGTPMLDYLDFKDAWHVLQSDMGADDKDERDHSSKATIAGNSLGFVAPFFSTFPPWKHLSDTEPGKYAAADAVQTLRVAFGVAEALQKEGQWETFLRHFHALDRRVLDPATARGLLVDRQELDRYGEVVRERQEEVGAKLTSLFPLECLPLGSPKVQAPEGLDASRIESLPADGSFLCLTEGTGPGSILGHLEPILVGVCSVCGLFPVATSHNCAPKAKKGEVRGKSAVLKAERLVPRFYSRLEFNPDSPDQIRSYLALKGLKTGKAKGAKTEKQTTNDKALEKLSSKDPFFGLVLERRELTKTHGTYVEGIRKRLAEDGRIHPLMIHRPSTLRLSSVDPNIQNVVHGDVSEMEERPWAPGGFRRCIVAAPGCVLVEVDFSAIEAVLTGWFCGDPAYIKLAQAGVHAYLTGVAVDPGGVPPKEAVLGMDVATLKALLKPFKKHKLYDVKKRTVHGVSYGLSAHGMVDLYPKLFPTRKSAEAELAFFFDLCPEVQRWQGDVRNKAARQNFLGGLDHPFRYRHWFFDVVTWDSRKQDWRASSDANRVVAYYPQSTAAGVIKEAALRLLDAQSPFYVGDMYEGQSPVRALIHDSILFEVPKASQERLLERAEAGMVLPVPELACPSEWGLGEHLTIGVASKCGVNWAELLEV